MNVDMIVALTSQNLERNMVFALFVFGFKLTLSIKLSRHPDLSSFSNIIFTAIYISRKPIFASQIVIFRFGLAVWLNVRFGLFGLVWLVNLPWELASLEPLPLKRTSNLDADGSF
jgi:hypothetical protein